jgi:hypothetical protein
MVNRNVREVDQLKPLIDYIEKNMKKGYKMEELKWCLISQGHSRTTVQRAIDHVQEIKDAQKPKAPEPMPEVKEVIMPNEEPLEKSWWGSVKSFFAS